MWTALMRMDVKPHLTSAALSIPRKQYSKIRHLRSARRRSKLILVYRIGFYQGHCSLDNSKTEGSWLYHTRWQAVNIQRLSASSANSQDTLSKNAGSKPSTIRDFLLITLSQAERRGVDPQERIARLSCTFRCPSIVVSKEKHEEGGFECTHQWAYAFFSTTFEWD